MSRKRSILSTRPLNESLLQQAAAMGIEIDEISLIETQKTIGEATKQYIASLAKQATVVVFTSMNAVEAVVSELPDKAIMPVWKIYCMGGTTFTFLKKYWTCESIIGTAKNATELAKQIVANSEREVTFFCGTQRREELPDILQQHSIRMNEVVVYETIETPVAVDKFYDGMLFFSPSAVRSFFTKNKTTAQTIFFAIGETTAAAIKYFCENEVVVSKFPGKEQLVELALKRMADV